jgi:hypothetical protein
MKYIFVLIAVFATLACSKKDNAPRWHWGTVTAEKNGALWEGEIYAGQNRPYGQGIDIMIDRFNDRGFNRERIYLFKIPQMQRRYPLVNTDAREIDSLVGAVYHTSLDDGDVAGDSYVLLSGDSTENYVEITEIKGKELYGRFQMSFIKGLSFGEQDPSAPDTVIFKNGIFHTRLID